MKKLLMAMTLGTTAIAGVAIAGQQTAPQSAPAAKMKRGDANGDGVQTLAEARAATDARFARLDADRDGRVTAAERTARAEARVARREARGGTRSERLFARVDTDRNGSIALNEHLASATTRFERVDANRDGRIDPAERTAMRDKRMARRALRPGAVAR